MKRVFQFFVFLVLAASVCCSKKDSTAQIESGGPVGQTVKVTTWNLEWFPGKRPGKVSLAEQESQIESVAGVLGRINPDILCVQEIKDRKALLKLAESMPGHTVQVVSDFGGTQEIAILSRFHAKSAFMKEFEKAPATPPRGFSYALFELGDHTLAVYSVHLKSNSGGIEETAPKREESARQLVRHMEAMVQTFEKERKDITFVLCGDFNVDPGQKDWDNDKTFRILAEAGLEWTGAGVSRDASITWLSNGRYPDAAFDHFFVKAVHGVITGEPETEKTDRSVSDHRPFSVTLRLPGK